MGHTPGPSQQGPVCLRHVDMGQDPVSSHTLEMTLFSRVTLLKLDVRGVAGTQMTRMLRR